MRGAVRRPLMFGSVAPQILVHSRLGKLCVSVCLQGLQPLSSAVQALKHMHQLLRDGVPATEFPNLYPPDELQELAELRSYKAWQSKFGR